MSLRVAVLQKNLLVGDVRQNVKIFLAYLEKMSKNADLVVTTELFLCGYPPKDLLLQSSFLDLCKEMTRKIGSFYRDFYRKKIFLPASLVGAPEIVQENGCEITYNSVFFFCGGGLQKSIRKRCLPNYDIFDEKRYFAAAKECNFAKEHVIDIPLLDQRKNQFKDKRDSSVRVLVTICEDMWIDWIKNQSKKTFSPHRPFYKNVWYQKILPELRTVLDPIALVFGGKSSEKKKLPQLIVNLSASPFTKEKIEQRYDVAKHALKNCDEEVMLLCVNQVGANDEIIFDGTSFLAKGSKKGGKKSFSVVKTLGSFVEEAGIFSFSFNKNHQLVFKNYQKNTLPKEIHSSFSEKKYEFPSIFSERGNFSEKKSKEWLIIRGLMLGISDYVKKNNFSSVLVGLSGGIDSAVTVALAVLALGPKRVFTISLPSKYSSKHSLEDSLKLVKNLGCHHQVFPIENFMEIFHTQWKQVVGKSPKNLVEENVQARMRGLILMAIANQKGHLLLTTGNKSELSVGYCTLYGDTNGALGVLGDCFKTEVYALARFINQFFKKQWIPKEIIKKEPSAELRFGQKDSDSLPPYDVLDKILELAIVYELGQNEVKKCGFDGKVVKKVYSLMAKSEHKRSQSPPVLKISQRAIGSGRRMPITKNNLW